MAGDSRVERVRKSGEYRFLALLTRVDPVLGGAWWVLVLLRSALPALFALSMGSLIHAVANGAEVGGELWTVGALFALMQGLPPEIGRLRHQKQRVLLQSGGVRRRRSFQGRSEHSWPAGARHPEGPGKDHRRTVPRRGADRDAGGRGGDRARGRSCLGTISSADHGPSQPARHPRRCGHRQPDSATGHRRSVAARAGRARRGAIARPPGGPTGAGHGGRRIDRLRTVPADCRPATAFAGALRTQ